MYINEMRKMGAYKSNKRYGGSGHKKKNGGIT